MTTCPYVCNNKTIHGYCCSTVCINPLYNCISATKWLEKADYVQVVRCKDCKHNLHPGKPNTVCGLNIPIFDGNGYCSEGERKDDAEQV